MGGHLSFRKLRSRSRRSSSFFFSPLGCLLAGWPVDILTEKALEKFLSLKLVRAAAAAPS
jgi:hypothetical protein